MKSMKAHVLGSLIIVMSIIIIGLSASYAFYINEIEEVNSDKQGVSVTSGELTMNFATTQTISAPSAGLIEDNNVLSSPDYTSFSVSLPSDAKVNGATYNLYLTDTQMTNNFKSAYLKWALYSDSNFLVEQGDFSGVTLTDEDGDGVYDASDITLLSSKDITKGNTDTYKLYVWLSYDADTLQNDLLNGTLSTKVGFRAVSK